METIQNIFTKLLSLTVDKMSSTYLGNSITSPEYPDIIAFGNVLVDMSFKIDDTTILDRYGLEIDAQGEISSEILTKLAQELRSGGGDAVMHPGGSALNTCRILKKLNGIRPLFFGSVGDDENCVFVKNVLNGAGLKARLQVTDTPTGQCICFILGDKVGLYANIGASAKFSENYLESARESENFLSPADNRQVFYIEGFFIPERYKVCQYIVKTFITSQKILAFNLNSSYILRENFTEVQFLLEHATLIFGNKKEFSTLVELFKLETVRHLAENLLSKSKKIMIITDAANNVLVYTNHDTETIEFLSFPLNKVSQEMIVDTTGAGDSFVAGFLNAFLQGDPLEKCLKSAASIAGKVITQIGCNLPEDFIIPSS